MEIRWYVNCTVSRALFHIVHVYLDLGGWGVLEGGMRRERGWGQLEDQQRRTRKGGLRGMVALILCRRADGAGTGERFSASAVTFSRSLRELPLAR